MSERPLLLSRRVWVIGAVGLMLLILGAANAHLVYVSFASQPECVTHTKTAQDGGGYRAARSAC